MEDNLSLGAGWHGHGWIEPKARIVKVATGYSAMQRRCARCHRDFITTPGGHRAVFVSIFSFFPLDEEVTERWVNLPCPGRRLSSDDDDRKRWIDELIVFCKPETMEKVRNLRRSRRGSQPKARSVASRLDEGRVQRHQGKSALGSGTTA
jgi:hypothetical protein